jgi:hypothetical protein
MIHQKLVEYSRIKDEEFISNAVKMLEELNLNGKSKKC